MYGKSYIVSQLLGIPGFVLFLCFRGFAQAWTARKLGDSTAYLQGYMTMNPMKHINLIGFIFLLIFGFGFSNPVPVNTRNFKNIKRDNAIQILSAPMSGIILMFLSVFALYAVWFVGYKCNIEVAPPGFGEVYFYGGDYIVKVLSSLNSTMDVMFNAILFIIARMASISVLLAVFFLLPLPGFDGYRLIANFLPYRAYSTLYKIEQYSSFIFFGFLLIIQIFPVFYNIVSVPAMNLLNIAMKIFDSLVGILI